MTIRLNLQKKTTRIALSGVLLGLSLILLKLIFDGFVTGTLTQSKPDKKLLNAAVKYLDHSPHLFAKLAEAEIRESNADLEKAEKNAQQAIRLSPQNYQFRLLLAEIRNTRNDLEGAEEALRSALKLAPSYPEVHWRLANVLVRRGKMEEAIPHFRYVVKLNLPLFPAVMELVWIGSNKNAALLKKIADGNNQANLKLALFLANQSHVSEAAEVFARIDRETILSSSETSVFFSVLTKKGFPLLSNNLWRNRIWDQQNDKQLIWNGGFETEPIDKLKHFDWNLRESDFAAMSFDQTVARSGQRSLLVEFTGRDTTRLDKEVGQTITVSVAKRYCLEFYVRTENLRTSEGPKVVISGRAGNWIAQSEPVSGGTSDWKKVSLNFTAPPNEAEDDSGMLFISIKRLPRFAFDEPTKGRVWFDDFAIGEACGK